jgi:hypothetical protein
MPGKRKSVRRTRHDPRSWILKAMQGVESEGGLLTSQIQKRIRSLKGSSIPPYSIYQGLRTLYKRRQVLRERKGREYTFRLPGSKPPMPSATTVVEVVPAPAPVPDSGPQGHLPHKLAPGDSTILAIGKTHVETATNVHGKLVLERHKRPSVE